MGRLREVRRLFVAKELLTTGKCVLSCQYCYIPKSRAMDALNAKIVRELKEEGFVNILKRTYDKDTQYIGLWGTEPYITLPLITRDMDRIKEEFPKLKRISFSTSFVLSPRILVEFLKKANDVGVDVEFQISLDGQPRIADKNRYEGNAEKVLKNLYKFFELMQTWTWDINIRMSFKPTLTIDNIREMNEHPEYIHEWYLFFDEVSNIVETFIRDGVNIIYSGKPLPTLTVPGKYTVDDGKELAKFFDNLRIMGYENGYVYRLLRLVRDGKNSYRARQFTCSGGDTNVGFDGKNYHICHRSFYLNYPEYVNSVLEMPEYKNWDVSHFESGSIDNVAKNYVVPVDDEYEVTRFRYVMRGYHDFFSNRVATTYSQIKVLAKYGQLSRVYWENDDMAMLLAYYLNTALSCPMENLLNTGSVHVVPVSLIRFMGNGAFEILVEEVYKIVGRV